MTVISKFYLLEAATPNTGTMPSGFISTIVGSATGALTIRDATDTHGSSNPDIESTITANANQTTQRWGHRLFVSRPLAAHTFAAADGNWTFSYARSESNTSHNMSMQCTVVAVDPATGLRRGAGSQSVLLSGTEPSSASTEEAEAITGAWGANPLTISDGDILFFEVTSVFTQGMSSAYTDQFAYDGTTEASTTTCASFVTPPAALTLFTAAAATSDTALFERASGRRRSLLRM
jgi:hypothetical protein